MVSYEVWDGVFADAYMKMWQCPDGWDRQSGNERLTMTESQGMWGGKLPADWHSIDGELYVVKAFLQPVHDESDDVRRERFLVVSDCQVHRDDTA